ncbi:MAG: uracil-DNA glycosylase [Proteobacteria bacterium]|nr:uracil-DNA glycosylase [Pseudomonadota bacterium]
MAELDPLSALAWLVDAGADEAIGDEPVNRLVAKAPSNPSPEGGSKFAQQISGRGQAATSGNYPSPKNSSLRSNFSTLPQGEGRRPAPTLAQQARTPAPAVEGDDIGNAMEIAARATTLPELKAALEAYDGCALKKLAANTVFADGTPGARILCIGEAPGRDEDKAGLPFVGRAGKLLDKMLAPIGLDRTKNVYIINVLPWRPPDNRNPDPVEVAKCIPFLRRHIELANPDMIVLLGAVAVRNVMGKTDGIMATRGKWLEYHVNGRMVPVMPTLHPAYLLRQPAHKKLAWRDLLAIGDKIKSLQLLEAGRANL